MQVAPSSSHDTLNVLRRVLQRFVQGKQSHDNAVLTAITALNVVIRMQPTMTYPFNVRSFFTDREKKDIGGGVSLLPAFPFPFS